MYISVGKERLEDTIGFRGICVDSREELAHLFSATTHQTSRIRFFPRERLKRLLFQRGKRHFSRRNAHGGNGDGIDEIGAKLGMSGYDRQEFHQRQNIT